MNIRDYDPKSVSLAALTLALFTGAVCCAVRVVRVVAEMVEVR